MDATSLSLRSYAPATYGTPNVLFWLVMISILPAVALFGGMTVFVMALAAGLAAIVWKQPQEAPAAGVLFLLAAGTLLPYGGRFDATTFGTEMYSWAAGLLMITLAAMGRIGMRATFKALPISARALLAVATAAAVYGWIHKAPLSYVLRQYYGVVLLLAYLGIALRTGKIELLLRRIASFGSFIVACFFVYYIWMFSTYGFHKETGSINSEAVLLAIVLVVAGVERGKRYWVAGGLALSLVPVFLLDRADVLTFLVALPVALGMKLRSKKLQSLCYIVAIAGALPAMFPPVAQAIGEQLLEVPAVGRYIPLGEADAQTLYERTLQLTEAIDVAQNHPILGAGMGASFGWERPSHGFVETEYIDAGWGYILEKMGLLGLVTFAWLMLAAFRAMSRRVVPLSACLVAAFVVMQFSEPCFFHFTTAPCLGVFIGLVLAQQRNHCYVGSGHIPAVVGPAGN